MKQIKTFKLPSEEKEANQFLAENPPENVGIVGEMVVINFDDQSYPSHYMAEELRALILSNSKQIMTNEIACEVVQREIDAAEKDLADINDTHVPTVGKKTKEIYDDEKDRKTKIEAYDKKVRDLKESLRGLQASRANLVVRNDVMQKKIGALGL